MPGTDACTTDEIEQEDMIRWDHAGGTFESFPAGDRGGRAPVLIE